MGGGPVPPIGGGHMGGTKVRWGGLARDSRQNLEVSQISKNVYKSIFCPSFDRILAASLSFVKKAICQKGKSREAGRTFWGGPRA